MMAMRLRVLVLLVVLAAVPAAAGPLRILAFGDSLTEGYGLPRKDGLVPQLQAWLDARGHDVLVLNGGLSGDTATGGRVRIGHSLARHRPDAVIVELGGNDLLLGLAPAMVEDSWIRSCARPAGAAGRCCWSASPRPITTTGCAATGRRSGRALLRATMRC